MPCWQLLILQWAFFMAQMSRLAFPDCSVPNRISPRPEKSSQHGFAVASKKPKRSFWGQTIRAGGFFRKSLAHEDTSASVHTGRSHRYPRTDCCFLFLPLREEPPTSSEILVHLTRSSALHIFFTIQVQTRSTIQIALHKSFTDFHSTYQKKCVPEQFSWEEFGRARQRKASIHGTTDALLLSEFGDNWLLLAQWTDEQ